nr:hypothetical protein [Pararhizobium sp. IMCC21322]
MSLAFTISVGAVFAALALGQSAEWVYYLPLMPLVLLLPTGLYLFVLPYLGQRSGNRPVVTEE